MVRALRLMAWAVRLMAWALRLMVWALRLMAWAFRPIAWALGCRGFGRAHDLAIRVEGLELGVSRLSG